MKFWICADRAATLGWAFVLCLACTGCSVAAVKAPQSANVYAEPEVLIEKATALAEGEIARLAAAEMVYRNKVMIHAFLLEGSAGGPTLLYMKLYRRFTGFELVNVERSPSVITPLKVLIRFNYDRVGTREVNGTSGDAELRGRVESDVAFVVHDQESIIREYPCTAKGDVIKLPTPILDRPNFWWKNGREPRGDTWIEDHYAPPGS